MINKDTVMTKLKSNLASNMKLNLQKRKSVELPAAAKDKHEYYGLLKY